MRRVSSSKAHMHASMHTRMARPYMHAHMHARTHAHGMRDLHACMAHALDASLGQEKLGVLP